MGTKMARQYHEIVILLYNYVAIIKPESVHGIYDAPLFAQGIHDFHDVKGLLMRHVGRFKPAVLKGILAGYNLILISCYLCGRLFKDSRRLVVVIDRYALGAVDVIYYQIALGATDLAKSAAQAECAGLYVGNLTVTV